MEVVLHGQILFAPQSIYCLQYKHRHKRVITGIASHEQIWKCCNLCCLFHHGMVDDASLVSLLFLSLNAVFYVVSAVLTFAHGSF